MSDRSKRQAGLIITRSTSRPFSHDDRGATPQVTTVGRDFGPVLDGDRPSSSSRSAICTALQLSDPRLLLHDHPGLIRTRHTAADQTVETGTQDYRIKIHTVVGSPSRT